MALSFGIFKHLCIFAIITNLILYEKRNRQHLEILCRRLQEHDLGENPVVVDTPEGRCSFLGAKDVLFPSGVGWQDRRTENRACGEGADEIIFTHHRIAQIFLYSNGHPERSENLGNLK